MFHPAFRDLIKPQWLATLTELKVSGGMPISELARHLDSSYMTVKQHCEDLTKRGYLMRTRLPRTGIGRPEIFYKLSEKAACLFPQIPPEFTVGMLDQVRHVFGETAPDKLLFQYFEGQEEEWQTKLKKATTLLYKARLFAKLREKEGLFMKCIHDEEQGSIALREFHHPLREVLDEFPRAIAMEHRAMEAAMGVKLRREVHAGADGQPAHIDFIVSP